MGGYNEDKDMVLILDTARFKYPSVSPPESHCSSLLLRHKVIHLLASTNPDLGDLVWVQHWVPLEGLFKAMQRTDAVTGKTRGFLRMGAQPRLDSVLFTLRRCGR